MSTFPPRTETIPSDPKIKIFLLGLGITVLNENARAQVGYLNLHETRISICKNGKSIMDNEPMNEDVLEILSPKGSGNCECYCGNEQKNHYDKMIDLSEFYGNAARLDETKEYPSKIIIDDSVLFTDAESLRDVIKFVQSGQPQQEELLKDIGTVLCGHTKDKNAYFKFRGKTYNCEPEDRFVIKINSHCFSSTESDFKHYHSHLTNAGDVVYNLKKSERNLLWFTDGEKMKLEEISESLEKSYTKLREFSLSDIDIEALIKNLDWLKDRKCPPAPCLKVTFTSEPRTLP